MVEIKNVQSLLLEAKKLDEAIEVPVGVMVGKSYKKSSDYKGIWNNTQQSLSSIVTDKYQIIQHRDVYSAVANKLMDLNIPISGRLDNGNDYVKADLIFGDNQYNIKDDAKGIKLGIRVINSYNKKTSFRLEMYGYRIICQNGMSFGDKMGVRELTFHTGSEKTYDMIAETTAKFVTDVINSNKKLQDYVSKMMADSTDYQTALSIIEKLITRKKHYDEMKKLLEKKSAPTRWDIYNAVTDYVSHRDISGAVQRRLEKRSQTLLVTPIQTLRTMKIRGGDDE